jgi:phenylalanyl-tRNA synthetase beta chain
MKISPQWLRDFVDLKVDNSRLAEDLTNVGAAVEGISGEGENTVFEMEITTNRPDEMNHYGLAREAAAIYDLPLKPIAPQLPAAAKAARSGDLGGTAKAVPSQSNVSHVAEALHSETGSAATAARTSCASAPNVAFPIEIEEPALCPRFTGRAIRNVSIKASRGQIVQRLGLLDQRPINNAVDATNYVLWEIGKPTHVFDLDLLEGGRIIVRHARQGETLKTLDGVERKLTTEDLVVADGRKPVGLAGVMGGFDTMITDTTKNVLIESAWWDPIMVRKMARRHGLHTDASHRFERGADFESTVLSVNRVAELILTSGRGELYGELVDVMARHIDQAPVELRISDVHRILGKKLSTDEIFRILDRLGFGLMPERGGEFDFKVRIPSWRLDVEREIDLIEEVARAHGYNKFPNTLPSFSGSVIDRPDAKKDVKVRTSLLALGYNEAVSLSFISKQDASTFSTAQQIELENPLSEEASVMRTSPLPGMLDMVAYNLNRGVDSVRLFELGNTYEYSGTNSVEARRASIGATGSAVIQSVNQPARTYSFYDLKGDVETLLELFEHTTLHFDAQVSKYYHPGRAARAVMDGDVVAQFGQIHPDVAAARKLRQDVFVGEIDLDRLYQHDLRKIQYEALGRYPAVERDFSFLFEDSVIFEKVESAVTALGIAELRSFVPVEIFRGGAVPKGKYSVLLRAIFQSKERTLREDEVAGWSARIIKALEGLGGVLRA